mgnify:CR=1 FL=1
MNRKTLTLGSFFFAFILLLTNAVTGQILTDKTQFTQADTLRGSLRPERTNFDIKSYQLEVKIEPEKKFISGFNQIHFKTTANAQRMQLDLFKNMNIDSIVYHDKLLKYERKFNAFFFKFPKLIKAQRKDSLKVYYSGRPQIAENPPWDGGFVFERDNKDRPHIGVAVQGTGASLWYPNKDHLKDEPESAIINIIAPKELDAVSNGKKVGEMPVDNQFKKTTWQVTYPINNYNMTLYLGYFAHFTANYKDLKLDYYPLDYNLAKAKEQFRQVKPMMQCFEEKFGFYPFKNDTYKLVESPYLGMEHQSAVAYGNGYRNGYRGTDLSNTGIGLEFDFIIIHETAHEWFGNAISVADVADLWIHEAFATYAEAVYVECELSKEKAVDYLNGIRKNVTHNKAIIGNYGVNNEGSSDMYFKGANFVHTLRTVLNDDEKWWELLKTFVSRYKYKTIKTDDVLAHFQPYYQLDLQPIFDQYLRYNKLPELVIKKQNGRLEIKWQTDVANFQMPIDINIKDKGKRISVTNNWKEVKQFSSIRSFKEQIDQQNMYYGVTTID